MMLHKVDETIPPPATEMGGFDDTVKFNDKNVKFKFKHLKDRTPGESWIQMVYGPSKTGKTFYAGTAGSRTLFINIGEGIDTLMSPAFTKLFPQSREMIVVDLRELNPNGHAEAFDMLSSITEHALKHFPDKFDNIIIDEATALRKFALNKAMMLNSAARTQTSRKNRIEEYVKADVGDYGEEMNMIEWYLGQHIPIFKEANKNFLMLAHERQVFGKPAKIGDEAPLLRILPGFTGKTHPDKIPSFFDDVFHSETKRSVTDTYYLLRTTGDGEKVGGARHGGIFPDTIMNPNFQTMLNQIKSSFSSKS